MGIDIGQKEGEQTKSNSNKGVRSPLPESVPIMGKSEESHLNTPTPHSETDDKGQDVRPKWIIFLESIPQWQNTVATIVLGIFAVLSSVGSIISACAAEDSANAAIENIRILKESLRPDIRLGYSFDTIMHGINENNKMIVNVKIKNFGNLPAKTIWVYSSADQRRNDFTDDIVYRNKRYYPFLTTNDGREFDETVISQLTDIQRDSILNSPNFKPPIDSLFLHLKIEYAALGDSFTNIIGICVFDNNWEYCKHNK